MFKINDNEWRVLPVPSTHYALKRSNGSYALGSCDNNTKTIYLNENISKKRLLKVLCHEVAHAAMFSHNVNLNYRQEELVADLIASYGTEIIKIAHDIYKDISKNWGT